MPNSQRQPGRLLRLLLVLPLAFVMAACSPEAVVSLLPAGSGPLLTATARGGECPAGACETSVVVERDGSVHQAAKPPSALGTVPAEVLAALEAAIRATDFQALRSHPFTGQCPTAYDGQELVFEFGTPGGVQRIASCEVAIDFGSPLFFAVSTAVGPFLAIPTS